MKCEVCRKRFRLIPENKYLACEALGVLEVLTKAGKTYECFDCPKCGCQNFVNIRLPRIDLRKDENDA